MALLVYGVMRARECPAELASVEHDGLSALVGEAAGDSVRVRRQTLLEHSQSVRAAMEHGPVLPLRFGVAFEDAATLVSDLLAPRSSELSARLDALEGKVEMQLKARFHEAPTLRAVLAADPELARFARRIQGLPDAAAHFERIRLGELIGQAVELRGEECSARIIDALAPVSLAQSTGRRMHEWMAFNGAFLVDEDRLYDFGQVVDGLGMAYAGELEITLIGPLPPHSFADHDWERGAAWA